MTPTSILRVWFYGLLSLAIIAGAVYLGHEWQRRSWGWDPETRQSVFLPDFGANEETLILAGAVVLGIVAVSGGAISKAILRATARATPAGDPDPRTSLKPTSEKRLPRPDGSELQIELYGPEDGTPLLLTHGWGLNSNEWNYVKRELSDRYRLIVWDLPGLGKSTRPANRDYSLENLAADLEAVLLSCCDKPAVLLGHSIGGMITLTFCRLFPEKLGSRVSALILTHTTPTDPVRTTSGAPFFTVIEKPVLVPLMYVTICLSPIVWLMNWLSYWNGSAHLSTKRGSFAGTETWPQIDFATSFQPIASPAVLARGMLGMMRYDAIGTLPQIKIPTLIIAGNKDSTTRPQASDLMKAEIPGSLLTTLAPAKHLGLIEHHRDYAKTIREFMRATEVEAHLDAARELAQ